MKKEKKQFDPDAFRDSLSGMNDDGSRKWV